MRSLSFGLALAAISWSCAPSQPQNEFVLNIALASPIERADGQAINGYATVIEDWIYEPLIRISQDGSSIPALANSVEKLSGGETRIKVRRGSTYSDGSAVALQDVASALKANGIPAEVKDDALIIPSAIDGVATDAMLPTILIVKTEGKARLGSGPFKIDEQDSGHILLRRRAPIPGRINTVRLTSYDGPREAMSRVLRGDANLLPQIEARDVEFFDGVNRLRVIRGPAPHAVAVELNFARLSVLERQEILRALPVAELSNTAFGATCTPWPRGSSGAAMKPGRPLDIYAPSWDSELAKLALAVRRALGERGGQLLKLNPNDLGSAVDRGDYELAVTTPLVWPFGMISLLLHSGERRRHVGYADAAVDAAIEAGSWPRVLDALEQDPPLVFICTRERIAIVDARIKNARLGPWGELETLPEWEVGE